jgi:hypothetical protein
MEHETNETIHYGVERIRSGFGVRTARLGADQRAPETDVTVAGTVETIDKNIRAVNIKTADGKFVAVDVPASAKRFDELKVGDKLKVTYNNNVYAR